MTPAPGAAAEGRRQSRDAKSSRPDFQWKTRCCSTTSSSEDERMVREPPDIRARQAHAARVEAIANERSNRAIMNELGELGLLGATSTAYGLRRRELCLLLAWSPARSSA